MSTKNTHGGRREGSGRKRTGPELKKALGVKVSAETKTKLVALHNESGHSQAAIVEFAIKKIKKLPKYLE